jgi:cell division protein FtsB
MRTEEYQDCLLAEKRFFVVSRNEKGKDDKRRRKNLIYMSKLFLSLFVFYAWFLAHQHYRLGRAATQIARPVEMHLKAKLRLIKSLRTLFVL